MRACDSRVCGVVLVAGVVMVLLPGAYRHHKWETTTRIHITLLIMSYNVSLGHTISPLLVELRFRVFPRQQQVQKPPKIFTVYVYTYVRILLKDEGIYTRTRVVLCIRRFMLYR